MLCVSRKLPELKALMKQHKIKGRSHMNKPAIISVLVEKGIIVDVPCEKKTSCEKKEVDPRYAYLKTIRNNPKEVEITDLESGEVKTYPSIYAASRELGLNTVVILKNNGKVWKDRYKINILE